MFSSSSNDTSDVNVPMNIIVDDDDDDNDDIEEVEPTKTKKTSSKEANFSGSKASKPPIPNVSSSSASGKKRKSIYWKHYDETSVEGEIECKYCAQLLHVCSTNGTSVMKNHLQRCKKYPADVNQKQKLLNFQTKRVVKENGSIKRVNVPYWKFDPEFCRKELAKMIIIDELPFIIVEREGFRGFCMSLHPNFVPPSRHTIARDCYALFIDERRKLKGFFEKLSSRVCFTTNIWTSGQNLSYMCLTAHFIDDDWNLHKRIINFCPIAGHSGELIGRAVEKCLIEWNLKNVLTVTVDNASSNDLAVQYLKRRLNHWGTTVLDGNYLHMRCVAHIWNLLVKDGLKDLDPSIVKIRFAVRFVRSSPARLEKFKACVEEEGINEKGLVCLDVDTRWNSTFLMLECALKFRKAFSNLESKSDLYIKEMRKHGGPPNNDDWKKVAALLPFLRIFYEATLKLSGSVSVTGNSYVPQIYGVGYLISGYSNNVDESIRNLAYQMKAKYDKYWANVDNINVLLFIALVLDPRYKLDYVEWVIKTSYDGDSANLLFLKVKYTLRSLFDHYSSSVPLPKRRIEASSSVTPSSASCDVGSKDEQIMDVIQVMSMRYKKEKGTLESEKKSELDKYLSDDCEEGNDDAFEILQFWKDQQKRYPILAKMARDVLAMPVSTVTSEYAFSTRGRVLDSFRTSLTPRMVEALICCQDWLRTSHDPLIMEDAFLEMEEFEKSIKDLSLEQPTIIIDESIDISSDL